MSITYTEPHAKHIYVVDFHLHGLCIQLYCCASWTEGSALQSTKISSMLVVMCEIDIPLVCQKCKCMFTFGIPHGRCFSLIHIQLVMTFCFAGMLQHSRAGNLVSDAQLSESDVLAAEAIPAKCVPSVTVLC